MPDDETWSTANCSVDSGWCLAHGRWAMEDIQWELLLASIGLAILMLQLHAALAT